MKILKPRGMRDVRALALGSDADAVNAYNFRSSEEVRVFLQDMQKQVENTEIPDQGVFSQIEKAVGSLFVGASIVASHKETASPSSFNMRRTGVNTKEAIENLKKQLEKRAPSVTKPSSTAPSKAIRLDEDFNITNTKKLESQFALIKSLHNKVEVLEAMELTIKQAFAGERNTLGTQLAKTRKTVETKLKAALSFISKAAAKKEPTVFREAVDPAVEALLARADGKFRGPAQQRNYLFVKPDKSGTLYFVFQRYVVLNNFTSDDEAFTYPQYVVVFTAAVSNERRMTMHVTTLHSERPPGTFKFGTTFTNSKGALQELDSLLDMDKMVDLMSKSKLGLNSLDKTKFSNAKQFIREVTIEGDHVRIRTNKKLVGKGADQAQSIIEKLFLDLKTLLGYGRGQSLKYKILKQADNTLVLDFVVVPTASGRSKAALTDAQRRILETHFGFDDDDVSALVRVMQKGY